ncbi:MAG: ABC transporter ATP-binding protein [Aureispira sp.]
MYHFTRTLRYLRYYRGHAVLNVLFNILAALFTIASFLVLKPFLDILFSTEALQAPAPNNSMAWLEYAKSSFNYQLEQYILRAGKQAGLVLVAGIVLITFLLKNLFRYLALYVISPVRYGIEERIRQGVFERLLELPLSYFSEERKGDLMSRITIDVQEIQWSVLKSIETIIRSPITILGSLSVMLYISPLLTGFSFVLILFVGLIIGGIARTLKRQSGEAQNSQGRLLSILDEALGGLRIIRAFNAESYQNNLFGQENHYYQQTMTRIMRRKDLSSPLTEFLGVGVVVLLLLFGGSLVFQGQFAASTFVVFITMFYNIIDPAKSFSSAYYAIQKGSAAIERIQEILDAPLMIQDANTAQPLTDLQQGIRLENVSFSYNEERTILDNITLDIPKGSSVALVGASGAGKSTLIDLLPRFYDLTQGRILLDGVDIKNYKLKDLRGLMSLVSQEAILFNDTVYNNLVFGLENVSLEAVQAAAKAANAHEFIEQLPEGYQSNIGDRGNKLSGGQRQRLTIARAILRNPPLLILDEATSALDAVSERLIQEALVHVLAGRTSIIIAHRLSTIQHADKIVVLQEGRIVEQGTHQMLLEAQGVYHKLVALQAL